MPPVAAAAAWLGTAAGMGTMAAAGVAVSAGSAVAQHRQGKKAAKNAAEANEQAMKDAKSKAAAMKEASAKRSNMFDGEEKKTNKSLLTAQKQKRRAVSGAQGTRLTGGKLGSPATAGGAKLGQ